MARPRTNILDRAFQRYVETDGCWLWTGTVTPEGYGQISGYIDEIFRMLSAHKLIYEAVLGKVPSGMHLDHLCRNRSCVNPAHMEIVTPRENILRGIGPSAVNALKTRCKRGHPLQGENLYVDRRGKRECRNCRFKAVANYRRRQAHGDLA